MLGIDLQLSKASRKTAYPYALPSNFINVYVQMRTEWVCLHLALEANSNNVINDKVCKDFFYVDAVQSIFVKF